MEAGYSEYPPLRYEEIGMPKRSRIKRESLESKALRKLRIDSGLSQRDIAEKLGVTQTKVAHSEVGRAYIRKDYVELFLKGLCLSWEEWDELVGSRQSDGELREECKKLLDRISDDKLRLLHGLLVNF